MVSPLMNLFKKQETAHRESIAADRDFEIAQISEMETRCFSGIARSLTVPPWIFPPPLVDWEKRDLSDLDWMPFCGYDSSPHIDSVANRSCRICNRVLRDNELWGDHVVTHHHMYNARRLPVAEHGQFVCLFCRTIISEPNRRLHIEGLRHKRKRSSFPLEPSQRLRLLIKIGAISSDHPKAIKYMVEHREDFKDLMSVEWLRQHFDPHMECSEEDFTGLAELYADILFANEGQTLEYLQVKYFSVPDRQYVNENYVEAFKDLRSNYEAIVVALSEERSKVDALIETEQTSKLDAIKDFMFQYIGKLNTFVVAMEEGTQSEYRADLEALMVREERDGHLPLVVAPAESE